MAMVAWQWWHGDGGKVIELWWHNDGVTAMMAQQ